MKDTKLEQHLFDGITKHWNGSKATIPVLHPKKMKYVSVTVTAEDLVKLIRSKITKALK